MHKLIKELFLAFFIICAKQILAQSTQNSNIVYIKAGKLFDSENAILLNNFIIKVEGNRITEVAKNIVIPNESNLIDLSDYTILPGLIDGHTHLLSSESPKEKHSTTNELLYTGDALRVLRAGKKANSFLKNGITTVRDLGNSGKFLDVALKKAIKEGTIDGPRMIVSGPIISSEGGQFRGLVKKHEHLISDEYRIVRSVDDAINSVRENITYGADIIKICANNSPNNTTLTLDEMKAIVKTAHRYNTKVTAHGTDDRAIWEAVSAGVDGIEHGWNVSDSTLIYMASNNVALIPTFSSYEESIKWLELIKYEGDLEKEAKSWVKGGKDLIKQAKKAGVTIVAGSDNYYDYGIPQGLAVKQIFIAYHQAGMKPLDILQSSTFLSAKFMDKADKLGVIKKGAYADIIAVKGDLINDFSSSMFNVIFVMKDGKIYVEP